jgi:diaminopimelate epimerase
MPLPFVKAEGTGNDFVVVDLRAGVSAFAAERVQDPAVVREICDRHFGVGADGVLAILPSATGDARMRVLNADGSEAEMCGNGLRCVAKVLYETDPALRRTTLNIETGAGVLACTLDIERGVVRSVHEEMGRPRLTRGEIPLAPGGPNESSRALREPIRARDREFRFTAVSMGNPHAVIFVDGDDDLQALATTYGPILEVADNFPRRTNVEFARLRGQEIDLVVWERGSGLTLACGTGACATVVAACLEERLAPGADTWVHLPGGTLVITVAPDYSGVRLCGPARIAFRGTLDDAQLARMR